LVEVDMTMAFSEPLGHDLKDGVCTRCGKAPAYNATLTADKTSIDDGETLTAVYTLTNPDGTPVAGKKIALAYPLTTEETSAWLYRQEEAVTDENGKVTVEIKLSREDGIEPGKKILLVMDPEEPRSDDVNAWTTFFFGAAESQEPAQTDTQPAPPTGDGSALFLALAGLSLAAAAFLAIKRKERV
ncbi:MAG: LPXTG cell wall anchor domain-containing protein, partial [Clostridia bacterium]|nr:LPXTG cell wall anchor domain-containing protein [Clostridia bacterium]